MCADSCTLFATIVMLFLCIAALVSASLRLDFVLSKTPFTRCFSCCDPSLSVDQGKIEISMQATRQQAIELLNAFIPNMGKRYESGRN